MPNLAYTRMVVDETLRLYPPAWITNRRAIQDDTICGYRIPADAIVSISPYVTHRDPALWENPEGFDPERFSPERSAGCPHYAYFPFGGEPRQCIGKETMQPDDVPLWLRPKAPPKGEQPEHTVHAPV